MTLLEKEKNLRRGLMWALVYSIPAFQAMLPVEDADLWWHLRTGKWIVENHTVPFQDYFSAFGMGKTWIAYSWLFEVLIYALFSALGLIGIVVFTLVMSLLIAFVLHTLVRRARLPFILEVALMAAALGSMKPVISPRSWLFSILFFALELSVLLNVRRSGRMNLLWVLPPLFTAWANFHIQFVYGLAALGLLLAEIVASRVWRPMPAANDLPQLSPARVGVVAAICGLAIFLTPYHVQLLRPLIEISTQTGVFSNVAELLPLSFRSPADWLILTLTLVAVFLLGWSRQWQIFPMLLLILAVFLGFRARRDAWMVVFAAIVVIGEFRRGAAPTDVYRFTKSRIVGIAASALFFTYGIAVHRDIDNRGLERGVERHFPAKAADFVITHRLPGPLFNHYDWGGYLIWKLPELPVSIDGRGNLHGDRRIERNFATWSGGPGWDRDPELTASRLVVAEVERPLVYLLRADPRFKLVYEDGTAAVFTAEAAGRGP